MPAINILDDVTINKIAAGEVVEKPMAVIKELVENSIDAKATSITVEIKNGGLDLMRVTDNGLGIPEEDIRKAFFRHATSKINKIEDLDSLDSLGFRGEALASIASVSMVECISKTAAQLTGIKYEVNGGVEASFKEVGCPDGTTFVVKSLFYNTPARKKFLKTPMTEGSYISDIMEKIAMSHPDISFRYINNNKLKFQTAGNGKLKDVIYQIYGKDVSANLVSFELETEYVNVSGYIGRPVISKGNRSFMNYYVNGRYVKSPVIYRAIEEGYDGFHMSHKFPFCVLMFDVQSDKMDVNVHPSKMEIRFSEGDRIYSVLCRGIKETLRNIDVIPEQNLEKTLARQMRENDTVSDTATEYKASNNNKYDINANSTSLSVDKEAAGKNAAKKERLPEPFETNRIRNLSNQAGNSIDILNKINELECMKKPEQLSLFERKDMEEEKKKDYTVVGCVFSTYWIVTYHDEMYIMDQHAAHEKILYEKLVKKMTNNIINIQQVSPPIVISLDPVETELVNSNKELFEKSGFEIESFGGNEHIVSGVPAELPGIASKDVLIDLIGSLRKELTQKNSETILMEKIASMSCKAAVKGGRSITSEEASRIVQDLFELDNPFNCPHGRPTLIKITKNELEKRFGRQL